MVSHSGPADPDEKGRETSKLSASTVMGNRAFKNCWRFHDSQKEQVTASSVESQHLDCNWTSGSTKHFKVIMMSFESICRSNRKEAVLSFDWTHSPLPIDLY